MFFPCFRVSQKRNTKRSSNGMNLPWWFFLDQRTPRRLGVQVTRATRRPQGWRARRGGRACPPTLWGPRWPPDLDLPPIYTHIPRKLPWEPQNHFSTVATFSTHEIPSRDLFRHLAGGGFDHGGLLHQHHCPSDEAWVLYLRPTGP